MPVAEGGAAVGIEPTPPASFIRLKQKQFFVTLNKQKFAEECERNTSSPLAVHIEMHHSVLQEVCLTLRGGAHTSVDPHRIRTYPQKRCVITVATN